MAVKYWSFAGLMITTWCNAACASCYLAAGRGAGEDGKDAGQMSVPDALSLWRGLVEASPHGCRVHITGGEPFGDYGRLICLARSAQAEGLAPLEKVETNAFWATGAKLVRRRVGELDAAGVGKLVISCDPYHQQFVPIERCRLAVRAAQEVLGPSRVQVRWQDWLVAGCDTNKMSDAERRELFARYINGRLPGLPAGGGGRDRLTGRAAEILAPLAPLRDIDQFDCSPCRQRLLRCKHVHIDPSGRIVPGTCWGIVLGVTSPSRSVGDVWRQLARDHEDRPILSTLAQRGPVGLLPKAIESGFAPRRDGYGGKCHLCWDIRAHLGRRGLGGEELFDHV